MVYRAISQGNIDQGTLLLDIATLNVIRFMPDDCIGEAARIMAEKRISSIVVTDGDGHPTGIVTERNMLHAMQSGYPPETALRKVMSSPVITVPESMTCLDAYQVCLRNGIRHLVIVNDDGLLLGVVSETDFRLHIDLFALAGRRQVMAVMTRSVFSLPPDASLRDTLNLMQSHRDSCVVVVEDERPVGIVTERDIVRLYSVNAERIDIPVKDIMTTPVLTVPLDHSINEAAERMLADKVRHLVVVDSAGRVAGLLNEHDLTHTMAGSLIDDKLIAEGAFLHTLMSTLPDSVWLKDANGIYLACNPRCEQFFGATEKSIIGKTDHEVLNKALAGAFREYDREALEKAGPCIHEQWIGADEDGRQRELLEILTTPMRDSQGKLMGVLGIGRDITERKLAEQALLDSEAKLREQKDLLAAIFENALDAVLLMDPDGVITSWSRQAEKIFGWHREQAVGRLMSETIIPHRYREAHIRGMRHFLATGEGPVLNTRIEIFALHRDGHEFPIELSISPIKTAYGYAFSSFIRDISERKHMERQLAEREELFRAIFTQAPSGIELIDAKTLRFVEANPAACRMLGYTHEEYLQMRLADIQADMDEQALAAVIQQLEISGGAIFHNRHRCKNGDILDVEINARMLDLSGQRLVVGVWLDITERKRAEEEIIFKNTILQTLKETSLDAILVVDENARIITYNQQFIDLWRLDPRTISAGLDAPVLKSVAAQVENPDAFVARVLYLYEHRNDKSREEIRLTDGRILDRYSAPIMAEASKYYGRVWYFRDITELKLAEKNLRVTASVFENSQEAILITDADNVIIDVNPAFARITGYSREEVLGRNPKLLSSGRQDQAFFTAMWQALQQNGAWRGEIWNRRKSGEVYAELLSIASIRDDDGKVQRYVAVFSDISHIKEYEAELSRVAHYDALTGIPNRVLLADRMKQAIAQSSREQSMVAVCYLDLDGFKFINDTMGHKAGDQVLIEVAKRIGDTIRSGDTVARLGGDEFVLLLLGLEKGDECVATLERLLAAIAQPISVDTQSYTLSASIGVSIYPLDDEDQDSLLRHADQAMYVAKQSGKNRFYNYDPALDLRVRSHHEFLKSIRQGLELGQFELHYQPKIDLRTKRLVGAEALIRWRHPERGLLPPAEFLRPIENTDLDIEIGDWVIATVLAQINRWHHNGLDIEISINISAHHLESFGFAEKLRLQLERYPDIPPERLQIEVLESTAINDIAIVREVLETCRKFGIRFALDDFGTGYSSLSHLSSLPVDVLKIDQSFVRDMLEDKGDMAIIQGIIGLARAFDRQTVAEGIEIVEHYRALLDMGCELGQGYCIARPMPADELINWWPE